MPVLNECQVPFAGLPTPAPDLLRTKRPAPRNLRHRRSRPKRLGNNPRLLLVRPPPSPARTSQNLNPPKPRCLRVVVNYVHKDRSMPKLRTDPAQIIPSQEEGFQRSAYHQQARAADRPAHPSNQLDRADLQGRRRRPASQRARRIRFLIQILPKAAGCGAKKPRAHNTWLFSLDYFQVAVQVGPDELERGQPRRLRLRPRA